MSTTGHLEVKMTTKYTPFTKQRMPASRPEDSTSEMGFKQKRSYREDCTSSLENGTAERE